MPKDSPTYYTVDALLISLLDGVHGAVDFEEPENYEIRLSHDEEELLHREAWSSQRLPPSIKTQIFIHGVRKALPMLWGIPVLWGAESISIHPSGPGKPVT